MCASDGLARYVRIAGYGVVTVGSLAVGLVLVWHFVKPAFLPLVPTPELLAVLGLFVLPVASGGALLLERKTRPTAAGATTSDLPAASVPTPTIAEAVVATLPCHHAVARPAAVPGRAALGSGDQPRPRVRRAANRRRVHPRTSA